MEEKISIQRADLLNAYKHASEEQKTLLESMFGKDIFQTKNIIERVKTFEDACEVLGEEHQYVKAYREWMRFYHAGRKDITAYLKLRIICTALNEGWKPTFDENEQRYYPWFYTYTKKEYDELKEDKKKRCYVLDMSNRIASGHDSTVYVIASSTSAFSNVYSGYLLTLKTEELAKYCGKQFIDIWADYLFG